MGARGRPQSQVVLFSKFLERGFRLTLFSGKSYILMYGVSNLYYTKMFVF